MFPISFSWSKEWNRICKLLGSMDLVVNFILIGYIAIKYKWSGIEGRLEGTLSWSHCWTVLWSVLDAHCLHSFSGHWLFWGILSEEFRIGHGWVIECNMIVHWSIKVFSVSSMSLVIILWAFNVKIWNPSQLTINISVLWNTWIVWHSGTLDLIHLIWIMFPSWF